MSVVQGKNGNINNLIASETELVLAITEVDRTLCSISEGPRFDSHLFTANS